MNKLLITTSLVTLSFFIVAQESNAHTVSTTARGSVQCLSPNGRVVSNSYCTAGNNAGRRPGIPSRTCYTSHTHNSGGGGGGGSNNYNGPGTTVYSQSKGWHRSDGTTDGCNGNGCSAGGGSDSGGGNGGGGGRVICTYFFLNNEISKDYYYADYEYTLSKIHPNTVKGYHFWAIPYVEKMYRNPGGLLTKLIRPIAINRAEELAYQMGVRRKPNYLGKFFRLCIEPACFIIGAFAKEKNYKKLYTPEYLKYAAEKYTLYRKERMYQKQMAGTPLASFVT